MLPASPDALVDISLTAVQRGLSAAEVLTRRTQYGPNVLPVQRPPTLLAVFVRQFLSPLIYILLAAVGVSVFLGDYQDAAFIGVVLVVNGIIGTAQEYAANRASLALRQLQETRATVIRSGMRADIDATELVPGDVVMLDAGVQVPADLELVEVANLNCDESLLTGESFPVHKRLADDGVDRPRAYAGTSVTRGRATGVVIATGARTRLGEIAAEVARRPLLKAPLILRMEHFARMIAIAVAVAIAVLVVAGQLRQIPPYELFMLSVGLAVSAIPEGLPVAISVALAVAMRRMARASVIVRNMVAVEALGSCTMIATDKTGTLTLNELTVTDIALPDGTELRLDPLDEAQHPMVTPDGDGTEARRRAADLLHAAALPNEADLRRDADGWRGTGDTVDQALLAAVRKGGLAHDAIRDRHPLVSRIAYEPDLKYAASLHRAEEGLVVFVKGAPETLIAMCDRMDMGDSEIAVDRDALLALRDRLTSRGLRVLAFARGEVQSDDATLGHHHLADLTFLGFAGMQDPVRPEVPAAIADCRRAGIEVVMITGDDPRTAASIAEAAGLASGPGEIATGNDLAIAAAEGPDALDALARRARIFARVEPSQKLAIVQALARIGHFVAVTGDGVNDAPALRHAHVGVAMGRSGTNVAREAADIIITDDNFASVVKGVREGRVAYANIRKVIYMLVSTGAAEVALFLLSIPFGLPPPLLPVQLLWLNLVTNGMQDVALAAERAEGDELAQPPRHPGQPIFDAVMVRRIIISTVIMGGGCLGVFAWLLSQGTPVEQARNLVLLLFVLFENFQTLNSRSERRSVFGGGFFGNRLLLAAVVGSQLLHLAAAYMPGLNTTLGIAPVSPSTWLALAALAAGVVAVSEVDKWLARRGRLRPARALSRGEPR